MSNLFKKYIFNLIFIFCLFNCEREHYVHITSSSNNLSPNGNNMIFEYSEGKFLILNLLNYNSIIVNPLESSMYLTCIDCWLDDEQIVFLSKDKRHEDCFYGYNINMDAVKKIYCSRIRNKIFDPPASRSNLIAYRGLINDKYCLYIYDLKKEENIEIECNDNLSYYRWIYDRLYYIKNYSQLWYYDFKIMERKLERIIPHVYEYYDHLVNNSIVIYSYENEKHYLVDEEGRIIKMLEESNDTSKKNIAISPNYDKFMIGLEHKKKNYLVIYNNDGYEIKRIGIDGCNVIPVLWFEQNNEEKIIYVSNFNEINLLNLDDNNVEVIFHK